MRFQLPPIAVLPPRGAQWAMALVDEQLRQLKKEGFWKIVLCVDPSCDALKIHLGDGSQFDLKVLYCDTPSEMGCGGALLKALPFLGENFFITYLGEMPPIVCLEGFYRFLNHPEAQGLKAGEGELGILRATPIRMWAESRATLAFKLPEYLETLLLEQRLVHY